jgi:hypothetical protein
MLNAILVVGLRTAVGTEVGADKCVARAEGTEVGITTTVVGFIVDGLEVGSVEVGGVEETEGCLVGRRTCMVADPVGSPVGRYIVY